MKFKGIVDKNHPYRANSEASCYVIITPSGFLLLSSLPGNILNGSRVATALPLTAAYPAAVIAALLAGKTVFTRLFFGSPVGFLRDKYFAL
jgi:hypothetical protein